MNKKRLLTLMGGSKKYLKEFDFTTYSDGAISDEMSGATWTIASGKLLNTPSLGATDLMAPRNGNAESGDPPTNWYGETGVVISSVADERTGGAGSKSCNVARTATKGFVSLASSSGNLGWHNISVWLKNIDGTGMCLADEITHPSTDWNQQSYTSFMPTAGSVYAKAGVVGSDGQQGRVDDIVVKKITETALFRSLDTKQSNISITSPYFPVTGQNYSGIVLCLDNATTPTEYVVIYMHRLYNFSNYVTVYQFTGGNTYTELLANTLVTSASNKSLSITKVGDQLAVYYGTSPYTTQVGATLTVNAALTNNTIHGLFSTHNSVLFDGKLTMESARSF